MQVHGAPCSGSALGRPRKVLASQKKGKRKLPEDLYLEVVLASGIAEPIQDASLARHVLRPLRRGALRYTLSPLGDP